MLYKNAYKKLSSLSAILLLVFFLSADFYAAPGDLDPTFGSGGKVTTDLSSFDFANSAVLQPDGKLIVAGAYDAAFYFDFVVVRYNSNGSLDASFGIGGSVIMDFGGSGSSVAHAVALQPDGKIVAAGLNGSNFALARLNSNGSLDSTFGNGGKVTTDFFGFSDSARAIIIQPDGKLVAAGEVGVAAGLALDFGLARYNSDGSLDMTFGSGGKVSTDFTGIPDGARAVVLQADGKLVAAGDAGGICGLARYNSNGSLDSTFGSGGKILTSPDDSFCLAFALIVQADGKLVTAGHAQDISGGDPVFWLARYNSDGTLDATFGNGGHVVNFTISGSITGLALQATAKSWLPGIFSSTETTISFWRVSTSTARSIRLSARAAKSRRISAAMILRPMLSLNRTAKLWWLDILKMGMAILRWHGISAIRLPPGARLSTLTATAKPTSRFSPVRPHVVFASFEFRIYCRAVWRVNRQNYARRL
ncbi:MAG: delta-60 repeat domain-containing protein [Acidobacteriota bacterium]|nr:delta-60 repeat domain-containing protein [Acidobacteriota bacterium]